MRLFKAIQALWTKPSIPLPIKGNPEAEKYAEMMKKEWEGVAEFEKRAPTSTFDINRMHYGEIPYPKKDESDETPKG